MMDDLTLRAVRSVVCAADNWAVRSAVVFVSDGRTVKLTRRAKPSARMSRDEFTLTIGDPCYRDRRRIRLCKKAGEPFPLKRAWLTLYPR